LAVVAGMNKPNDHAEPTQVERLNNKNKTNKNADVAIYSNTMVITL